VKRPEKLSIATHLTNPSHRVTKIETPSHHGTNSATLGIDLDPKAIATSVSWTNKDILLFLRRIINR